MRKILAIIVLTLAAGALPAQEKYVPSAENLANREWFRDAKFGLFIHWGIYSMLADGEWVLTNKGLNEKEYQQLAAGFCPSRFDAREWARLAKEAGMKYICFTSRHHDGFSMFDTEASPYNVVDATPFGRDVVRELAEACREEGLKLFLYYSHIDWHRPDYYPWGRTGQQTGREPSGTWDDYLRFMNAQLTELLTNYGPIGGLWFDGWWDKPDADWQLERQYALAHRLQPGCLIGNNHHRAPFEGEDFQMFERDLPGQNTAGYSGEATVSDLPLESCETTNQTWGYNISDRNYKPAKQLIHTLVKAAGNNANLLLNVGPRPSGDFPAEAVSLLREIGEWTAMYGPTLYGTRAGEVAPQPWGVTTRRGDTTYVHILDLNEPELLLPVKDKRVKKAVTFKDGSPVEHERTEEGLLLRLGQIPTDIDHVVEIIWKPSRQTGARGTKTHK